VIQAVIQSRAQSYSEAIYRMQSALRFGRLAANLMKSDHIRIVHRHGVTTVVARTCDIPKRYLIGIAGFRLAQYLRVGYVNVDKVVRDAMFCEPLATMRHDDWHVVCLDHATGEILGYVELVSNGGCSESVRKGSGRKRFPVEEVHNIDIFDVVDAPEHLTTQHVREIKRMMHNGSLDDRRSRYRVSIELILGMQWVIESTTPTLRVLIGDAEAHVALRHLVVAGLSPTVISGTTPELPAGHLLGPTYNVRSNVEPFYGQVPDATELAYRQQVAEQVVMDPNILANLRLLVAGEMKSKLTRVSLPVDELPVVEPDMEHV